MYQYVHVIIIIIHSSYGVATNPLINELLYDTPTCYIMRSRSIIIVEVWSVEYPRRGNKALCVVNLAHAGARLQYS